MDIKFLGRTFSFSIYKDAKLGHTDIDLGERFKDVKPLGIKLNTLADSYTKPSYSSLRQRPDIAEWVIEHFSDYPIGLTPEQRQVLEETLGPRSDTGMSPTQIYREKSFQQKLENLHYAAQVDTGKPQVVIADEVDKFTVVGAESIGALRQAHGEVNINIPAIRFVTAPPPPCPHNEIRQYMADDEPPQYICGDCGKLMEESDDCDHPFVTEYKHETEPSSVWICTHCGTLQPAPKPCEHDSIDSDGECYDCMEDITDIRNHEAVYNSIQSGQMAYPAFAHMMEKYIGYHNPHDQSTWWGY